MMRRLIFPMLLLLLAGLCGQAIAEVQVWAADPLVKIFPQDRPDDGPGGGYQPIAEVARGEVATFQLVVRSDADLARLRCSVDPLRIEPAKSDDLDSPRVRFVGYVPVKIPLKNPPADRVGKSPGDFPDPLLEQRSIDVPAGRTQAIWITLPIPGQAAPGDYRGQAKISATQPGGEAFSATVPLRAVVYPARVGKARLWVSNLFQTRQGYTPFPQRYSDGFWDILGAYAHDMAEHRQTVARVVPLELADYSWDERGSLHVDFAHMDRWIEIFQRAGIDRFEGQQFGWRRDMWNSPYIVSTYVADDSGKPVERRVDPTSADAERFYSQFLPALQQHLAEKGLVERWIQHVADEPTDFNAASYRQIIAMVHKHAPKLRLMDAILTKNVAPDLDVPVPLLDLLDKNFPYFQARQRDGKELWFYTCLNPKGEYANRFIELPLIKTRLLHWINFRYGVSGYLHWGYNFWGPEPYTNPNLLRPGSLLPAGDGWIVYPRSGGGVIDSIRFEAMRDGIADHELLSQLADRDPDAAMALAKRHILAFNRYDCDIADFRTTRRDLLRQLGAP